MEGQRDAELRNQDQRDHEKEPAEDEWKSWKRGQVRDTLHLVSAAAQWILLLACLIYLGIHSLQPSTVRAHTFFIMGSSFLSFIPGRSIKGVAMNLTAEVGSIQIRNGSIMIACDGLYLVSLKSVSLYPDLEEEDLLKLTLWKTDKKTSRALWE
ncbi:TNFL4 factor, partial [Corythaeola cristata]|nr:TNFL4 factor [Corythaeola cristata]